jgi:AmmeMemoRadiSam system protein B
VFKGASVFTGSAYETPLGSIPIAQPLAQALTRNSEIIKSSWLGHHNEHSLEVQLPFLQVALESFALIPIVLGSQDFDTVQILAAALTDVLAETPHLIVASSDLSHYHAGQDAEEIDRATMARLESWDETQLDNLLTCEACGRGAILTAMLAAKKLGADTFKSLHYENSGTITGDLSAVVGYMSAAIYAAE